MNRKQMSRKQMNTKRMNTLASLMTVLALTGPFSSQALAQGGKVFDKVVKTLRRSFHDRKFRRQELDGLVRSYSPAAHASQTLEEERVVIHAMLKEIPASHLALYSKNTYDQILGQLTGRAKPNFGFELEQRAGRFYASGVVDGGPAARKGIQAGDRILAIDSVFPGRSKRLDWRNDDAYLQYAPLHRIIVGKESNMRIRYSRGVDAKEAQVELTAARISGKKASKLSIRIIEEGNRKIGYVHLWFIFPGTTRFIERTIQKDFADVDGIIIDLRGHGGIGNEAFTLVALLRKHKRKGGCLVVALTDGATRSAKEMIASGLQKSECAILVGRKTAGAVLPASFQRVGPQSVLMYPSVSLPMISKNLEGIGVTPDVPVVGPSLVGSPKDALLPAGIRVLSR